MSFPSFNSGVIVADLNLLVITSTSQILLYMSKRYFIVSVDSLSSIWGSILFSSVVAFFVVLWLLSVLYLKIVHYMIGDVFFLFLCFLGSLFTWKYFDILFCLLMLLLCCCLVEIFFHHLGLLRSDWYLWDHIPCFMQRAINRLQVLG